MEIIETCVGPYVIYNRETDEEEFEEPLRGPGPWHWGRQDENGNTCIYRWGYETRYKALHVMWTHVWSMFYDYSWP
jgi:hypothetical protein